MARSKVGEARYELSVDTANLIAGFNTAKSAAMGFGQILRGGAIAGGLTAIGTAALNTIQAIEQFAAESVQAASDVEKSFARISGIISDVGFKDLEKLRPQFNRISRSVAKDLGEMAEAFFFVNSAGRKGAEGLEIMAQAGKLAQLGFGDMNQLVTTLAQAMNAFGESVPNAERAADLLVATVEKGIISADEVGEQFGATFPFAVKLGLGLEQVAAAMAGVTRTGTRVFEGATQVKNILKSLATPTKQTTDAFNDFGISLEGFRLRLQRDGLLDSLVWLRNHLMDNTDSIAEAQIAFRDFFPDTRGLAGVFDLLGESLQENTEIFEYLTTTTGNAERAFDKLADTLDFKVKEMKQSLSELKVAWGEALAPGEKARVDQITEGNRRAQQMVENIDQQTQIILNQGGESRGAIEASVRQAGTAFGIWWKKWTNHIITTLTTDDLIGYYRTLYAAKRTPEEYDQSISELTDRRGDLTERITQAEGGMVYFEGEIYSTEQAKAFAAELFRQIQKEGERKELVIKGLRVKEGITLPPGTRLPGGIDGADEANVVSSTYSRADELARMRQIHNYMAYYGVEEELAKIDPVLENLFKRLSAVEPYGTGVDRFAGLEGRERSGMQVSRALTYAGPETAAAREWVDANDRNTQALDNLYHQMAAVEPFGTGTELVELEGVERSNIQISRATIYAGEETQGARDEITADERRQQALDNLYNQMAGVQPYGAHIEDPRHRQISRATIYAGEETQAARDWVVEQESKWNDYWIETSVETLGELGQGIVSFAEKIAQGKNRAVSELELFASILGDIMKIVLSKDFFQAIGVIGTAATGGRHSGLTLVGEEGPELVDLNTPGMVYTTDQLSKAISGGGEGPTYNITINGGDPGANRQMLIEAMPMIAEYTQGEMTRNANRPSEVRAGLF